VSAVLRPIINLSQENILCESATVADKALRRMRGLLGRASLPAGEGMLLMPAPSIHTAFMRFPIDVVFTDRLMRVIRIEPDVPPWRAVSARHASNVLELAAGETAKRGLEIGDQLAIGAPERSYMDLHAKRAQIIVRHDVEVPAPEGRPGTGGLVLDPANPSSGELRVLLIAGDRRFRAVAMTLLERRGLSVAVGEASILSKPDVLAKVDVVVLDAGSSITGAARDVATISAAAPKVGVVIVAERPAGELSSMPVLPKWGSFDGLISAIEHARPGVELADDVHG
jgi:uncharacterized membrane protein (UPF0127 family)